MYLKVNISLTIIHNKLPEYQVPETESKTAGFFGYLKNPLQGYLKSDYKKELSTKR